MSTSSEFNVREDVSQSIRLVRPFTRNPHTIAVHMALDQFAVEFATMQLRRRAKWDWRRFLRGCGMSPETHHVSPEDTLRAEHVP